MKGKAHSTEEIIRILRQADGGETAQRAGKRKRRVKKYVG